MVAAPPVVVQAAEHQDTRQNDAAQADAITQTLPETQSETSSDLAHVALDVAGAILGLPPLVAGLADKMVLGGVGHGSTAAAVIQTQPHQRSSDVAEDESEI